MLPGNRLPLNKWFSFSFRTVCVDKKRKKKIRRTKRVCMEIGGGVFCYMRDWKGSFARSKVQTIWASILSCCYTWNIVFFTEFSFTGALSLPVEIILGNVICVHVLLTFYDMRVYFLYASIHLVPVVIIIILKIHIRDKQFSIVKKKISWVRTSLIIGVIWLLNLKYQIYFNAMY